MSDNGFKIPRPDDEELMDRAARESKERREKAEKERQREAEEQRNGIWTS